MSEYKDFLNMIEITSYALEIQGRAEESFRRLAKNATSEVERNLFIEIGEDFGSSREKLQIRKQKLLDALNHLRSSELSGGVKRELPSPGAEKTIPEPSAHRESKVSVTERDPVCDMQVKKADCKNVSVYQNGKYFFCCEDCRKAFDLSPQKYIRN